MAVLVKRYSNRRLYDTDRSRYITIEELARRLRAGEDFQVVDADTGRDLTKRTLLQVVLLESMDLVDVLPLSFLKTLIRIRDKTIRDLFVRHLRMHMELFAAAQKQVEDNLRIVQEQMAATTQLMLSVLPFGKGGEKATVVSGRGEAAMGEREVGGAAGGGEAESDTGLQAGSPGPLASRAGLQAPSPGTGRQRKVRRRNRVYRGKRKK